MLEGAVLTKMNSVLHFFFLSWFAISPYSKTTADGGMSKAKLLGNSDIDPFFCKNIQVSVFSH